MTTTVERDTPLTIVDGPEETALLERHLHELGAARDHLSILEAGCGTAWPLNLGDTSCVLTGIDLNEAALAIRRHTWKDLDREIIGDLRTVDIDDASYDVIYSSFVLEHVEGAEIVLTNFARWLRAGGLLIIRIPDPRSAYGFLSRITPFWFHVLYKRYIAGMKEAGRPGHDPFPTVYDPVVSRQGIQRWCQHHMLTIREEVGWNYTIGRRGLMAFLASCTVRLLGLLSFGRLATNHVNLTYVIEKPLVGRQDLIGRSRDDHCRSQRGARC